MTRLLLVRHGETEHNRNGIIQGDLDTDLNETGIEQAQQLSDRLRDQDIGAVYSSTLQRARRTAEIIAGPHDLEVTSIADLNERSYGELEGESIDTAFEQFEQSDSPWHTWKPESAEAAERVTRRTIPVLEQIRTDHTEETVVVVAHSAVNRSVLATLVGADAGYGRALKQDNCCINELRYTDYIGWQIHCMNDVSHLRQDN